MQRFVEILRILQYVACLCKCLCNDRIQYHIRPGDRVTGTDHTELEFIAGKCKR